MRVSRLAARRSIALVLLASGATIAIAGRASAQRVQVSALAGYSPGTGTQFELASGPATLRARDGGGPVLGVRTAFWLMPHVGLLATGGLRFTGHRADFSAMCPAGVPCNQPPEPVRVRATEVVMSARLALRETWDDRVQVAASLGPSLVRFADSEYRACSGDPADLCGAYYLAERWSYGAAAGLSVAYAIGARVSLILAADDVMYHVQPAAASSGIWASVRSPLQHQLWLSIATTLLEP